VRKIKSKSFSMKQYKMLIKIDSSSKNRALNNQVSFRCATRISRNINNVLNYLSSCIDHCEVGKKTYDGSKRVSKAKTICAPLRH